MHIFMDTVKSARREEARYVISERVPSAKASIEHRKLFQVSHNKSYI